MEAPRELCRFRRAKSRVRPSSRALEECHNRALRAFVPRSRASSGFGFGIGRVRDRSRRPP
jgi:hypothetical protein